MFYQGRGFGTSHGLSANGWINQELFHAWFIKHSLKHVPLARPLLLLLDGHSRPDTVRLSTKEKGVMFVLSPNVTHLSQLFDKG